MDSDKYILCIDDDEDDCSLLGEAILKENPSYTMCFKKSGDEAVAFLIKAIDDNKLPELIILDLNMPGMDGRETLVRIQELLGLTFIPILFLTTNPSLDDMLLAEHKSISVFTKPTTMSGYDDISKTIFKTLLKEY